MSNKKFVTQNLVMPLSEMVLSTLREAEYTLYNCIIYIKTPRNKPSFTIKPSVVPMYIQTFQKGVAASL